MSAKEMSMDRKIINQIKSIRNRYDSRIRFGPSRNCPRAATTLYTVYAKCLNFKKDDPLWINRDRFVMSSGHGSALLYATLYMAGSNSNTRRFKSISQNTDPSHQGIRNTTRHRVST